MRFNQFLRRAVFIIAFTTSCLSCSAQIGWYDVPTTVGDGPSLNETINYINAHANSGFSLSFAPGSLRVSLQEGVSPCGKNNRLTCGNYGSFPARQASGVRIQLAGTTVLLKCAKDYECIDMRMVSVVNGGKETNENSNSYPKWPFPVAEFEDREMAERFVRAWQRALRLIANQYEAGIQQQRQAPDPFSSPK